MPMYDLVCKTCGNTTEVIMRAGEILICKCGSIMTKQVGKLNFELKGKGWAKDNYAN